MHCTSCGAELRAGMRFCVTCGQAIGAAPASGVLPPAAPAGKGFAQVTPAPESWVAHNDPHAIGLAFARLGSSARRSGRSAILLAASHLDEGERVESLVQGRVMGTAGVAVLTVQRILIVNEAEWRPLIHTIALAPDVTVQGWEDERTASLLLQTASGATTIDMIRDRLLAHEFAHRLRGLVSDPHRAANASATGPTAATEVPPPQAPTPPTQHVNPPPSGGTAGQDVRPDATAVSAPSDPDAQHNHETDTETDDPDSAPAGPPSVF